MAATSGAWAAMIFRGSDAAASLKHHVQARHLHLHLLSSAAAMPRPH
jgi:hypothetical protein